MAGRALLALGLLLLTAGAVVLIFVALLAGAVDSAGLNKLFFLQADTSDIPNAGETTRWTFWNHCDSDKSSAPPLCNGIAPAYPLDPSSGRTFDSEDNVPEPFLNSNKFFLMSRFMFAFVLIALFFSVFAVLTSFLALCTRVGATLSGLLTVSASLFQALAATLMTVTYVQGRDAFRAANRQARIGRISFSLMWAAYACLVLSTILSCLTRRKQRSASNNHWNSDHEATRSPTSKAGFFQRRFWPRRTRSPSRRGSLRKSYG